MGQEYKRNQVEEAIYRTLSARDKRIDELRFRLKRLLVTDRRLGTRAGSNREEKRNYAFYSARPPGSGVEVMFSGYEAFAILTAIILLEHGLPQLSVVKTMRLIRKQFEMAHVATMAKDPAKLFDEQEILKQALPGMIATDNTDPVFLVFAGLTGSSVDPHNPAVAVCRRGELGKFFGMHNGKATTFFDVVGLMHKLAVNLSQTTPSKRGRGAS
jgi:hypothetical protein